MNVECPTCGESMEVGQTLAGKTVTCLACGQQLRVPMADVAPVPDAPVGAAGAEPVAAAGGTGSVLEGQRAVWLGVGLSVGVLVVGALVAVLVLLVSGMGDGTEAYRPYVGNDAVMIGWFDVAALRRCESWPAVKSLLGRQYDGTARELLAGTGLKIDDVDYAWVSVDAKTGPIRVLRCTQPVDVALLRRYMKLEPIARSGIGLFQGQRRAVHMPDAYTVAVGGPKAMESAMARVASGQPSRAATEMDELRARAGTGPAWCVFRWSDDLAREAKRGRDHPFKGCAEDVAGFAVWGTVNGSVDVNVDVWADTPDGAKRARQSIETYARATRKRLAEAGRARRQAPFDLLLGELLESVELTSSGDTLTARMTVGGPVLAELGTRGVELARRSASRNNLHQIGLALHNYHDCHGTFPPGYVQGKSGPPGAAWTTMLLPFVDEMALYNAYNFDLRWDGPENRTVVQSELRQLLVPKAKTTRTAGGFAVTHYVGVGLGEPAGSGPGILDRNSRVRIRDVRDGTPNTLLAGEAVLNAPAWAGPGTLRDLSKGIGTAGGFGGAFTGGAHFLFADGQVRFLSDKITPDVLRALVTRAGNEAIDDDQF